MKFVIEWGGDFDSIFLCMEVEEAVLRFKIDFAEKEIYIFFHLG